MTNEFGIRDDVLKLILNTIPESNVRATIAAIKMVQYDQRQIGVTDGTEMNLIANKASSVEVINEQKYIDSSELRRVFGVLHHDGDIYSQAETLKNDNMDNAKDQIISLLKEQLEHEHQEKNGLWSN